MANWLAKRWSKEDTRILEANLDRHSWNVDALPLLSLALKFGRTESAIVSKAKRLVENYNRTYEWSKEETQGAFYYYLKGESTKQIHDRLLAIGSQANIEQVEGELKRLRNWYSGSVKAYAEERGLPVAKNLSLDLIEFFLRNKNTESDFIRKALHTRIKNGH